MLLISIGANGHLYFNRAVQTSSLEMINIQHREMMDLYDQLACDLICGKSIEDANRVLYPHEVVRFKERRDYGRLHIGNGIVDICLDGAVITAIDSSANPKEWPECLKEVNRSMAMERQGSDEKDGE